MTATTTAPQLDSTAVALRYEQGLNRLGRRLTEMVTANLTLVLSTQAETDRAEAALFQAVVQELSAILEDEIVLITFCRGDRGNDTWTVHAVFSEPLPTSSGRSDALLEALARLQANERLTDQSLQHLIAQAPESVWQMLDTTRLGWLLTSPKEYSAQPADDAIQLKSQLIERSLDQCVVALRQIKLIQVQRQQYQELATRNQELVQANQLKSEFLANTSHEIRTPLSSILGFTHLLREQGYSPTNLRHREYLNIILNSGQHLLALINDILDLSKIEANQLDLQWETVDVPSVCQTAMTLVREKANDKGLNLRLEVEPQVRTLIADSLRLKQMLFNLLSNALKFTLRGSVGMTVTQAGEFLRFTVWDTGIGIAQEQQRLLFRPYSQVANTAVSRDAGTGLGLALTQKLAELHGGWVEIKSELEQGSQFTILLPLVPIALLENEDPVVGTGDTIATIGENAVLDSVVAQQTIEPPQPTATEINSAKESSCTILTGFRPNHLLLVEDNAYNAKLLLTCLSKSGYEVTWVTGERELWQALDRSIPALILMDINLPDADGLALIQQLKANLQFQAIPIIAQTAMAMTGDRTTCLAAGAVDYISKPIDLKALVQLIAQYVNG